MHICIYTLCYLPITETNESKYFSKMHNKLWNDGSGEKLDKFITCPKTVVEVQSDRIKKVNIPYYISSENIMHIMQ